MRQEELLTVREASAVLGLSVPCLRTWIASRKLTFVRLGRAIRVPRTAVEALIEAGTVPAREDRGARR